MRLRRSLCGVHGRETDVSEVTPEVTRARNGWVHHRRLVTKSPAHGAGAAFDRMIAEVERAAAARALTEAAEIAEALDFGPAPPFSRASAHQWGARQAAVRIRARAAEIREGKNP